MIAIQEFSWLLPSSMLQFRIDDIGACTKQFNQYGKKVFRYREFPYFFFPLANLSFFKRLPPFRRWAVYDELTAHEWKDFLSIFKEHGIIPIIAITAVWVERDNAYTPFPEKFPEEARLLKEAAKNNEIIVANHGLTHCVVGSHLPKFWGSNRRYHREFWGWLPAETHREHIVRSQEILENYFEKPVEILVPPGNVWSIKTYRAMRGTNLKKVLCNRYMVDSNEQLKDVEFVNDRQGFFNFHDRELKLYGKEWLIKKINEMV